MEVALPSAGAAVDVMAIVTRSIERLSLHVNAGYEVLTAAARDEHDGRWALAAGASYPLGAPRFTRLTIAGDVFAEQAARRGGDDVVGVEAGFRSQLTPRIVWDAGAGTEVAGPADRSRFFFTTGISLGF